MKLSPTALLLMHCISALSCLSQPLAADCEVTAEELVPPVSEQLRRAAGNTQSPGDVSALIERD